MLNHLDGLKYGVAVGTLQLLHVSVTQVFMQCYFVISWTRKKFHLLEEIPLTIFVFKEKRKKYPCRLPSNSFHLISKLKYSNSTMKNANQKRFNESLEISLGIIHVYLNGNKVHSRSYRTDGTYAVMWSPCISLCDHSTIKYSI